MKIDQLYYLCELAKYNSMNKAAESLFVSQSTLRSAIASLETEIGTALVASTRYGTQLTVFGQRVVDEALVILDCIESWKKDAKISCGLKEDIIVGITQIDSYLVFQNDILGIKKEYPHLTLRLLRESANEIIQGLKNGKYQIGMILAHPDDEKYIRDNVSNMRFNLQLMCEDEMEVMLNKDNPLAEQTEVVISELMPYCYCGYSELEMWWNDSCRFFITGFNENNVVHVDAAEHILTLISQNVDCYTIMLKSWAKTQCYPHNVVHKHIKQIGNIRINHYLIYPNIKKMSFGEKKIFDKIQNTFDNLQIEK